MLCWCHWHQYCAIGIAVAVSVVDLWLRWKHPCETQDDSLGSLLSSYRSLSEALFWAHQRLAIKPSMRSSWSMPANHYWLHSVRAYNVFPLFVVSSVLLMPHDVASSLDNQSHCMLVVFASIYCNSCLLLTVQRHIMGLAGQTSLCLDKLQDPSIKQWQVVLPQRIHCHVLAFQKRRLGSWLVCALCSVCDN